MLHEIVGHEDGNSVKNDVDFRDRSLFTLVFYLIFRLRSSLFYRLGGSEWVGGGSVFYIR